MSAKIVLVWLGTSATYPGAHDADLASWASSRVVTLEEPAPEQNLDLATSGDEIATRVETLLADARTASYADPRAAETALSSAELLLRGNPSLPEAAWLMAETCLAHAALVRKDDPELSRILERRATLLEGRRAPSFGEGSETGDARSGKKDVGPARRPPEASATTRPSPTESPLPDSVALEGPLPTDAVEIDGATSAPPERLVPGEHHVRVLRRGRLAWAGWVTAETDPVVLSLPPVVPCSDTDFDRVAVMNGRVTVTGPVLCPNWAVARDVGPTSVEVARCEHDRCGTLLPWSRTWGRELEGPMQPKWGERPSYAWLPWTALGVAVTTAAGIVLYRSGAFDREGAPRDTVTFSGPGAK